MFRVPGLLVLTAVAAVLAACAEPAALRLSVHRSALLGERANPPLWVWVVDGGAAVAAVEVSLDGAPYRRLDPSARSFRPPAPLQPGRHTLRVRVRTAGAPTLEESAAAQVAALPGRPPVPGDPCYPAGDDPLRCGGGRDTGQWSLRQIRQPDVWQALAAQALGEPGRVVVAVLDTGYVPHPDLLRNLDATAGYDFVRDPDAAGDGDGIDPDATDPGTGGRWHGTAIAGVIAAQTDNGRELAGMGWPWGRSRVTIMPVRVVGQGGATTYDAAQGLLYAAGLENDAGVRPPVPARIINLSLAEQFPGPGDPVLEEALARVTAAGAIVVAAAGNHRSLVRFPATSPHTVAVGSVDARRALASTSNFGPEIDIVAPGGDDSAEIRTLAADSRLGPPHWIVGSDHGTSLAAAHVSGALALLAGIAPSLTLSDARSTLAASAVDLGAPGRDDRYGPGLLDAFALIGAYPPPRSVPVAVPIARSGRGRRAAGALANGAGAPGGVDPRSLIIRFGDRRASRAAAAEAGERLERRHAVAGVMAGAGGYALVRLRHGQDRRRIEAQLRADPAVAAVYDNRLYRPAGVPPR